MEIFTMLFVLSSFLFFPSISTAKDIITPTVSLRDGESLVSSGGTFELGFFSPGNSKNRYVGIWFNGISPQIVVWVANRETPLTDHSGALNITDGGVLVLFSDKNSSIWSSNFTSRTLRSPVAQLLESGNLVVKDGNDDNSESTLVWQSFDYPGNTLLPGMKLGWNSATGINRFLSSWKAAEDPSPGEFSYSIDHGGYPQLVLRKGRVPHYRVGSWNGLGFTGSPELTPNEAFKIEFVSNDSEAYYKFDLMKDTMHSRLVLNLSGSLQRFLWIDKTHSGNMIYSAPADRCDTYDLCGAFAFCKLDSDPLCSCLQGFVPNSPRDWTLKNTSSGCLRKGPSGCTNQDEFQKFIRVKLPDTSSSRINKTMSLEECKKMCLTNCSCTAYANLDVRGGGTGCLLWFGNLIDIKEFDAGGQDLFVRIPPSELDGTKTSKHSGVKRKVAIIVSCGAVVTGVLILGLVFNIRKKKSKSRGNMKNIREKNFGFEGGSEDMELITFDLATVSRATDNFSNNNKLGQGGFGPVYKGILEEGQNIAVKRLSKCSGQGIKEFMNEVVLIAKLQHRNLVKLLGCCIEGDEKMLIYEYMPNKSLDYFIFDDTRSKLLNWDQRINIIGGIARGLLYLHQDSRLRIIHRDLKTSNVLLDKDMNPKISDFGTARAFGGDQTEENTNRVVGTYGYMSPEYVVDGLFSVKSDVYSFGVMMLEILSGQKNRGFHHPDHQLNLLGHAWMLWIEGRPTEIMDEKLDGSCAPPEVSRCIHIALLCVQQQPEDRPNMASVVLMLGGEGSLPIPKQPGFFTERNSAEAKASSPSKYESHSINEMSLTLLEARF